jgi:hypothetical protein
MDDLYFFAFCSNDPFNKILRGIERKNEYNNIPSLRFFGLEKLPIRIRDSYPINKFVDQQVVSHQQRPLHRAGRDFKSLDNKGSDKKSDQNRNEDRFQILFKKTFLLHFFGVILQSNGKPETNLRSAHSTHPIPPLAPFLF